ncbi:MAG: hypothetical protein IJO36_07270 [Clostridia bacterium]|nr:hypothetical protein [Clostridia bacterium]
MDKNQAWRKFSKSGAVEDYLEFRNICAAVPSEAEIHENEYRRSGAQGHGHRRK